jgi:hypothetical protein
MQTGIANNMPDSDVPVTQELSGGNMIRTLCGLTCAVVVAGLCLPTGAAAQAGAAGPKKVIVIGCVKQGRAQDGSAEITITDFRGGPAATFQFDPKDAKVAPLHVGHQVEVAGTIDPSAGTKAAPRLKIDTVQLISIACWAPEKK